MDIGMISGILEFTDHGTKDFSSSDTSSSPQVSSPQVKTRVVKKRAAGLPRRGKKPYPKERLRVLISVRILPATKEALLKIGCENIGRAIDELVAMAASNPAFNNPEIPVTRV